MTTRASGIVIAQTAVEIGGDMATSYLPVGYSGRCAIVTESDAKVIAVLSSGIEAFRIAAYAITPDGGYGSVRIYPTQEEQTHASLCEWISG